MKRWKRLKRRIWRRLRLTLNSREYKAIFRLGKIARMREEQPIAFQHPVYVPVPLVPQKDGTFVYVDPVEQKQTQQQIVHNPLPPGTLARTWHRQHKTRLARLDDPREAG